MEKHNCLVIFTIVLMSAGALSAFCDDSPVKNSVTPNQVSSKLTDTVGNRWIDLGMQKIEALRRELEKAEGEEYHELAMKALAGVNVEFVNFAKKWIKSPHKVEAYVISPDKSTSGDTLYGYPILARHPGVPAELVNSLKKLLLDRESYSGQSLCEFSPGLALKFIGSGDAMTVLICFSCEDWEFMTPRDDESFASSFSPVSDQLKAIAYGLFPNHFEITAESKK